MNPYTEQQLNHEKLAAQEKMALGDILNRLESNADFQKLINYFENRTMKISLDWASTGSQDKLFTMQGLLNFKNELEKIRSEAKQAVMDLNAIHDFETLDKD